MIRTKSIYAERGDADGLRVLVTRHYPRGVKRSHFDAWYKDLAPSAGLLKSYRGGAIQWDAFMVKYKSEIDDAWSLGIINWLHLLSAKSDITMLCYERDGEPCHRHILREAIANLESLDSDVSPIFSDGRSLSGWTERQLSGTAL